MVRNPIKILTHFAHESYQQNLAEIPGVEYYHVIDPDSIWPQDKKPKFIWPENIPRPSNIKGIYASNVNPADYDLVLIHWHPFIETFSRLWGDDLPIVFLEHTWPYQNMPGEVNHWKNVRHEFVDYTVYITESSKEAWAEKNNHETATFIYHSIDINKFPKKNFTKLESNEIMTVTNEFISRDWACGFTLWATVLGITGKPYFPKDQIALYGYGNDAIKPYAKGKRSHAVVLNLLQNAALYFNPAQMSPIPMSLLEAIAVGTPIVSTTKCEAGKLFKNGVHGIFSDDVVELRNGIKELLNNPMQAQKMAECARAIVQEKFAPEKFKRAWLEVFNYVITL